jgi:hypothetical protein
MTLETLDRRVSVLEQAVSDLQRQSMMSPKTDWLERFTGSFKDEPAFDEVIEYGRQFRRADRPDDEGEGQE